MKYVMLKYGQLSIIDIEPGEAHPTNIRYFLSAMTFNPPTYPQYIGVAYAHSVINEYVTFGMFKEEAKRILELINSIPIPQRRTWCQLHPTNSR